MTHSPVLFMVFNRPNTTGQVFQAIRAAQPPRLYVASDGSRDCREGEHEIVMKIREYIKRSIDWDCEVKYLFRDRNLGCGKNVSSAISWFFEHEEQGIILEDDCLPSESFFLYCDELLERYKLDDQVMMVAGGNYLFSELAISESYSFCKYQLIWGWATWRRAWNKYDPFMVNWPSYKKTEDFRQKVDKYDERLYWREIFERTYKDGLSSTWDYQWLLSMWINGGCSIFPNENLISNIGFGIDATHTINVDRCGVQKAEEMHFPLIHPERVEENECANNIICTNFYMRRRGIHYFAYFYMRSIVRMIKLYAPLPLRSLLGMK